MKDLLTPGEPAPDFTLNDIHENLVTLSAFRGNKVIVLYFLRGFM